MKPKVSKPSSCVLTAPAKAGLLGAPLGPSRPSPPSLLPVTCSSWVGSADFVAQSFVSFLPLLRNVLVQSPVPDATFLECTKRLDQSHGHLSMPNASSPARSDDVADRRRITTPKVEFPPLRAARFPSRPSQSIFPGVSKVVKLPDAPGCHLSHSEMSSENASSPLACNPIAEPCAPQIERVSHSDGSDPPSSLQIHLQIQDSSRTRRRSNPTSARAQGATESEFVQESNLRPSLVLQFLVYSSIDY